MQFKYLNNATVTVPEHFFRELNPAVLTDIESSVTARGDGDMFDHKPLMDDIRKSMIGYAGNVDQSDGLVAEILHKGMPISKREASFASFWHYGSIFSYLEYIKWRWLDGATLNRERILGAWRRNALGRLWWWAEITYDAEHEEPYFYTKRCARSQEFMLHAVDDFIGGDKGIMLAMCDQFFPEDDSMPDRNLVRAAFAKLNAVLDTVAADSLSNENKIRLVKEIITEAEDQREAK